LATLNVR